MVNLKLKIGKKSWNFVISHGILTILPLAFDQMCAVFSDAMTFSISLEKAKLEEKMYKAVGTLQFHKLRA